jgi:RNA polymerase sigma-70 factor (ECF subfamily)
MEDLYQEVVLNLWKSFPKFRHESQISTWIYRVALNTCITDLRQNLKFRRHVPLSPSFDITFEPENMESELKELYSLIYRLNRIERSLILLWLEEKNYQEISDITGLSVSNVGVKLKRIKEKLVNMSNL